MQELASKRDNASLLHPIAKKNHTRVSIKDRYVKFPNRCANFSQVSYPRWESYDENEMK
jgi:hypothetical protein